MVLNKNIFGTGHGNFFLKKLRGWSYWCSDFRFLPLFSSKSLYTLFLGKVKAIPGDYRITLRDQELEFLRAGNQPFPTDQ